MPDEVKKTDHEESFLDIDTPDERSGSFVLSYVLVIIVSVIACGFLIYYKFHTDSLAADKSATLQSLITTLESKNNAETEKKVNNINSAIKILSAEKKTKFLFKIFIDELKTKITNDVKLNNLSIDNQGVAVLDGESNNYRSVADLATSLESSSGITDVEINSLSLSPDDSEARVIFSITADLKDWGSQNDSVEDEADQETSEKNAVNSSEGGTNE